MVETVSTEEQEGRMNNIKILALTKLKATDSQRDSVPPGEHNVDFSVRVRGKVTVGENFFQTVHMSIPYKELFAIMVLKFNQNPDLAFQKLQEMPEEERKQLVKSADSILRERSEELRKAATKEVRGKVTAKLDYIFED